MPIGRLIFILVLAMALAAATIAVAAAIADSVGAPMLTIGGLGLIALCASFAYRRFSDGNTSTGSGDK